MGDNVNVFNIGKPCAFHESVDTNHRIGRFLRSRMSIIDLIPCTYKLDFAAATEESNTSSGLVPQIKYDKAMENYRLTCSRYGLGETSALRLFTTDDTSASDSIQNNLKDNYFQSGLNTISEAVTPLQDIVRSFDQNLTSDVVERAKSNERVSGVLNSVADNVNLSSANKQTATKLLNTAIDVIAKGHRISLPSIWSDSSYTPNFQAVIKLASPYGHPDAIKEFIIKPLMHLLILCSPKTSDGVSYGMPYSLTIKAYGLNYSPIGMVSNITLRRGGNDSSYNIYKQPLSIDVSLDFQYLVKGFAHFDHIANFNENNIFETSNEYEYLQDNMTDTSLPTIGHIVKSLKPREPEKNIIPTTFHSSMTPARMTKNLGYIDKSTDKLVSGFMNPDDIILANTNKNLADKYIADNNINNVKNSFATPINPNLNLFNV